MEFNKIFSCEVIAEKLIGIFYKIEIIKNKTTIHYESLFY